MTFIFAFLALIFLILFHEFGHFLVARLNGVAVEKFSIGFGKKIFSFNLMETEFILSAIPLGGYVKMKAENPEEKNNNANDEFINKKWYQKIIIAFAGPLANFILAFIIMIIVFWIGTSYEDNLPIIEKIKNSSTILENGDKILEINNKPVKSWTDIITKMNSSNNNQLLISRNGKKELINFTYDENSFLKTYQPKTSAIIGDVIAGLPAYKAGLMKNDKIIKINSQKVKNWYDMREKIINCNDKEIALSYIRDNEEYKTTLISQTDIIGGNKMIGITQKLPVKIHEKYTFTEGIKYGFISTISLTVNTYYGLFKLIQKPKALKNNIGSPIMLFSMTKQTAKKGISSLFTLFASISIMLMIMNLLPIPVLDGGQIIFYLIEGIKGDPLSIKAQIVLQNIGFLLLLSLMVFSFYSDFEKIFQRQKAIKKNNINTQE